MIAVEDSKAKPFHVLLIEDNPADVFYVKEINSQNGDQFIIHSVSSVLEARDLILKTQENYDVVLLDLNLEETSGIETFHEFSKEFPYLPIVVITGVMNEELVQQCLEEGAQDFIVKGARSPEDFLRSVRFSIMRAVKRGLVVSNPRLQKTQALLGDVREWLRTTQGLLEG